MSNYRLSEAAKEDLVRIAWYGDENFGREQSDKYRDRLKTQFSMIADNPLHYMKVDHIHKDYRRSVCGSHSIYYCIEEWGVLIVRVLRRQDVRKALSNDR